MISRRHVTRNVLYGSLVNKSFERPITLKTNRPGRCGLPFNKEKAHSGLTLVVQIVMITWVVLLLQSVIPGPFPCVFYLFRKTMFFNNFWLTTFQIKFKWYLIITNMIWKSHSNKNWNQHRPSTLGLADAERNRCVYVGMYLHTSGW